MPSMRVRAFGYLCASASDKGLDWCLIAFPRVCATNLCEFRSTFGAVSDRVCFCVDGTDCMVYTFSRCNHSSFLLTRIDQKRNSGRQPASCLVEQTFIANTFHQNIFVGFGSS